MEKRLRQALRSSAAEFLSEAIILQQKSVKNSLRSIIHSISPSSDLVTALACAIESSISTSLSSLHDTSQQLHVLTCLCSLCLSHPKNAFPPSAILPALRLLHDNLRVFESHPLLSSDIAALCEIFWKDDLPGRESLISQSLPFILSRSLTLQRKADVHRAYALREAFTLFDFDDDSIEDLKTLLIRCLISPVYLKNDEGRRFLAFILGLSRELMKEGLEMIKSQIPFGRKSTMVANGEILFKMWKGASEEFKQDIEDGFIMGLVDGAIHARSKPFAASIRRVLGGFVSQRITEGVEKLLFRLSEPIIFRSLQVANSEVRLNALHLFLDLFPLDDPEATKEIKDALFEKQFFLLERLLVDDCPDVRSVAVEGCCRILHLFWEILPTGIITKFLTKIFDDMSHDVSSNVRLSALNGISFLMDKAQAHEIIKVLLPRVSHLAHDNIVSNRVAFVDLLLNAMRMRSFDVERVVDIYGLFESLQEDDALVSRRMVRLLMASSVNSCDSIVSLMKRLPLAGARFCEFAASEGADESVLADVLAALVKSVNGKMGDEEIEGVLMGCYHLCNSLPEDKIKLAIPERALKSLFKVASTSSARSSVLNMFSRISNQVRAVSQDCMRIVVNCGGVSDGSTMQSEARAALKLIISLGRFEDVLEKWAELLQKASYRCHVKFGIDLPRSLFTQQKHKKLKATPGKKRMKFEDDFSTALGISWQIKDLLLCKESRELLLSSRFLHICFLSLKVISDISIVQYADASSFSGYSSLALYMAVEGVQESALEETIDHLLQCVSNLLTDGEPRFDLLSEAKVATSILKLTVDALSLGFIWNMGGKCLTIGALCAKHISRKLTQVQESDTGMEEQQKPLIGCVKSFLAYSAKLVNVTMRNSEEAEAAFCMANEMIELINAIEVCLEANVGLRLIGSVKKWVPDIVLGLGSVSFGKEPEWLMKVMKEGRAKWMSAFGEKEGEEGKCVAAAKVMEMAASLVEGAAEVRDGVGAALLAAAVVGLEENEWDWVPGVVRFVCERLVGDDQRWNQLPMMLALLPRIYALLQDRIHGLEDHDVRTLKLSAAKALLQPVWFFHVYETARFSMEH